MFCLTQLKYSELVLHLQNGYLLWNPQKLSEIVVTELMVIIWSGDYSEHGTIGYC